MRGRYGVVSAVKRFVEDCRNFGTDMTMTETAPNARFENFGLTEIANGA